MRLSGITSYFAKKSGIWILSNSILVVLLFGVIDYMTGYAKSISVFYLIPVLISTWYTGVAAGILTALIAVFSTAVSGIPAPYVPDKYFTLYWNAAVRTIFFITSILILNAWKKERIYARTDYLTGISNRYNFSEILRAEMARGKRFNHALSLVYMDVDNFKTINDQFGHKAGDDLLKLVAKILRENFRSVDTIARLGGDEFVILMPETESAEVEDKIRMVQKSLLEKMNLKKWPATFSIGIAVFTNFTLSPDEMIKTADLLMYKAKQNGKNCITTNIYEA
jgi:diguanylate cyclase (GGDEF)-like protein